ncbi:MAG TPA: cysteine desulfurase family protein [Gemmataceae bacterium]|nr:cysteine desulfurase family protein [Gemmataceae bacterium]
MKPIYLDYNATTPLDPAVLETMLPYLRDHFGNPSSSHVYGQTTHEAVERSRKQVADLLGAEPAEIIFTSGGTEASNHALKGVVFAKLQGIFGRWAKAAHIITSAVEHPATLEPCAFLKRLGCRITILPVDKYGWVDPEAVRKAADSRTTLVSIMHANNEVGTVQPIREIAAIAHERGILVHTDAAQSLGKIPVDVNELGVDLLSVAGHKLYAPKGVGALYVRRGVKLEPFMHGAGHEGGRRAGTENVPYLVGLGTACTLARQSLPEAPARLQQLRDRLWEKLHSALGDKIVLNGHPENRLPNTLNVNLLGVVGADFLQSVPEIAASTGSACHAGHVTMSPVLTAMGVPPQLGRGAVRLSVGRFTTQDEIDSAAQAITTKA